MEGRVKNHKREQRRVKNERGMHGTVMAVLMAYGCTEQRAGKKVRVLESEERLMAYNWQK